MTFAMLGLIVSMFTSLYLLPPAPEGNQKTQKNHDDFAVGAFSGCGNSAWFISNVGCSNQNAFWEVYGILGHRKGIKNIF